MGAPDASLGQSIPADTPHAVSVSLPTWKSNVGYEEGQQWVVSKMVTGYPRSIAGFAEILVTKYGTSDDQAMLFSCHSASKRLVEFLKRHSEDSSDHEFRILDFAPCSSAQNPKDSRPLLSVVLYPSKLAKLAKSFWQHTGEGVSSRRAEHCQKSFEQGTLVEVIQSDTPPRTSRGPKRYRKDCPGVLENGTNGTNGHQDDQDEPDHSRFIEERFGRNLDVGLASDAKLAIKRRIAGSLTANKEIDEALQTPPDEMRKRDVSGLTEDDVFLYPCGMNSIYHAHRSLLACRGELKSICYGFPYIDTLKVLEKFGPGCLFYGNGSTADLDDLERRLESGEKYLALFCEFPSNPLLATPNLHRIRHLANTYDFAVVVDETVGNFLNTHVLPHADIVVSSLTKIFSGDSNVMGGSAVLNSQSPYYRLLHDTYTSSFEDTYWAEDAIFMERNSRDFVSRIDRINHNASAICTLLNSHPRIKKVYYPKVSPSREFYDSCRTATGGYGGLLSATFYGTDDAAAFFDNLAVDKGPSLGTNFTIASPFVVLAHYYELEWAAQFGVEVNLVRFSVGLEEPEQLLDKFRHALAFLPIEGNTHEHP